MGTEHKCRNCGDAITIDAGELVHQWTEYPGISPQNRIYCLCESWKREHPEDTRPDGELVQMISRAAY